MAQAQVPARIRGIYPNGRATQEFIEPTADEQLITRVHSSARWTSFPPSVTLPEYA